MSTLQKSIHHWADCSQWARRSAALVLVALVLSLYAWTVTFEFAFDDGAEVVQNELVHSWSKLPSVFSTTAWAGIDRSTANYRPLTSISFTLNHSISRLEPWSYHAVNVALHAVASVLVLLIGFIWRLPRGGALAGAALFAVHPVHVEVVANVAGRKDVLVALLLLAMLLCHRRALCASRARAGLWSSCAIASLALALFSKELALMGIALVAAQDLLLGAPRLRAKRLGLLYLGYAAATAGYLYLRWQIVGGLWPVEIPFVDNPIAKAPSTIRIPTTLGTVARGLALLLFPRRLSPDYSYATIRPASGWLDPSVLEFAAMTAPIVLLLVILRRDRRAWLVAAFYCLALLPASNLLTPIGSVFGERFLYLPSVAFCLAAGVGVDHVSRRLPARARTLLLLVLIATLAGRALAYAAHWRNDSTLFAHARRVAPNSVKVHVKWAEVCRNEHRYDEALASYRTALALLPGDPVAHLELATLLDELGRVEEAEPHYRVLLAALPSNANVLYRLGVSRRDRGRLDEAAALWMKALALRPKFALALGDLGTYHLMRGDLPRALALLLDAANADPELATTFFNLAIVYDRLGDELRAATSRARYRELIASQSNPDR